MMASQVIDAKDSKDGKEHKHSKSEAAAAAAERERESKLTQEAAVRVASRLLFVTSHFCFLFQPLVPAGESGDAIFAFCEDRSIRVYSMQVSMSNRRFTKLMLLSLPQNMALMQVLRGHDSAIHGIYRDEWCSMSDHVVVQTKLGTVYVWVLSSGDLERCFEAGSPAAEKFLESRNLIPSYSSRPGPSSRRSKAAHKGLAARFRRNKAAAEEATASTQEPTNQAKTIRIVPTQYATLLLRMPCAEPLFFRIAGSTCI